MAIEIGKTRNTTEKIIFRLFPSFFSIQKMFNNDILVGGRIKYEMN
jgi:hypothetical protein